MRRLYLQIVIRLIRKHFPEGISVITDDEENIIAYQWTWSRQVENEVRRK